MEKNIKYEDFIESISTDTTIYTYYEQIIFQDDYVPDVFNVDKLKPFLFDYQNDLKNKIIKIINQNSNGLLALPTGAGKTRTAAVAILEYFFTNKNEFNVAWLAPTKELLEQAHSTFYKVWKEYGGRINISTSKSYKNYNFEDILFTTPHEVYAQKDDKNKFSLVVFDEAHQSVAKTFNYALEKLSNSNTIKIGLSATPGRISEHETSQLSDYFHNNLITSKILGEEPVKFLQNRNVLSRLSFKKLGNESLSQNSRLQIVADKISTFPNSFKSIVFTKSITDAKNFTLFLRKIGIEADYIEGDMPIEQRKHIIKSFELGHTRVLVNQKLLATGFDSPGISCLFLLHKIGSPIMFEQIVGRASRGPEIGGSPRSTIYEFEEHLKIHGTPNSYNRYKYLGWF